MREINSTRRFYLFIYRIDAIGMLLYWIGWVASRKNDDDSRTMKASSNDGQFFSFGSDYIKLASTKRFSNGKWLICCRCRIPLQMKFFFHSTSDFFGWFAFCNVRIKSPLCQRSSTKMLNWWHSAWDRQAQFCFAMHKNSINYSST